MKLFGSLSFSARRPTEILRAIEGERTMVAEREIREAEDDEALLRSLIRPEEDRRRLHPELPWLGGYRWFRSANVIPMERYRERRATFLAR